MHSDTPAPQEKPQRAPLFGAIPTFAAPPSQRLDPALPTVDGDPSGSPSPSTATADGSLSDPLALSSPSVADGTSRPTSTSGTDRPRLVPGGDPAQVAKAIGGALLIVTSMLSALAYRSRRKVVRQPTPKQRDDIAIPLARAAVRHLDLTLIGPTFADLMEATVSTHDYVMDGPLLVVPTPLDEPLFADDYDEETP